MLTLEKTQSRVISAWCMYDWANSAFATTIMAVLFPPFFRKLAMDGGITSVHATALWGYICAISLLLVTISGPLLGAIADRTGGKKKYLWGFALLGICATAAFTTIDKAEYILATILFIAADLGFGASIIFYESLLPHISPKGELDRISAKGYAYGYLGGGLLLIFNALLIVKPQLFGIPSVGMAVKISFVSVALWWAVFSLPLLLRVPEPPRPTTTSRNPLLGGFSDVITTLKQIPKYPQIFLFLVAFWLYNDGICTIIKMATAYGDEMGIKMSDMITALIITQLIGWPSSILFGKLGKKFGPKPLILAGLGMYSLICVAGYFMSTALHFYLLATMVGTVQGGTQALSRSLFARMVPKEKSSQFFGFFSTSSKFAGIFGPLLFGLLGSFGGSSRIAILSLIVFFIVGGGLLMLVKVPEEEV